MSIRLHNDLTRRKEEFIPREPGRVSFYNCGPTVYNLFHIGNARTFVTFDALRRYLRYRGFQVTFVQNFTDVDDKIINRSREEGIPERELAEGMIREYFRDADSLGIERADNHPRVTDTVPEIIEHIGALVEKGFAYIIPGDGVYYRVMKKPDYGKLSGRLLTDLQAGARVEVDERKEHPADFALWKLRQGTEIAWDSPWGPGRPGWHIECSVMARKYLGDTIDLHTGGEDLLFPHHENEIAQSEPVTGQPMARYWLHGAFLNLGGEKMAKSTGNILWVRDAVQQHGGEALYWFLLSVHYRKQMDFTTEALEASKAGLITLHTTAHNLRHLVQVAQRAEMSDAEAAVLADLRQYRQRFTDAVDDDFNAPLGQSVIFDLRRETNTRVQPGASRGLAGAALSLLTELANVFGALRPQTGAGEAETDTEAEALAAEWAGARQAKNWAEADRIRSIAREAGVILENTPAGVRWRRT